MTEEILLGAVQIIAKAEFAAKAELVAQLIHNAVQTLAREIVIIPILIVTQRQAIITVKVLMNLAAPALIVLAEPRLAPRQLRSAMTPEMWTKTAAETQTARIPPALLIHSALSALRMAVTAFVPRDVLRLRIPTAMLFLRIL